MCACYNLNRFCSFPFTPFTCSLFTTLLSCSEWVKAFRVLEPKSVLYLTRPDGVPYALRVKSVFLLIQFFKTSRLLPWGFCRFGGLLDSSVPLRYTLLTRLVCCSSKPPGRSSGGFVVVGLT